MGESGQADLAGSLPKGDFSRRCTGGPRGRLRHLLSGLLSPVCSTEGGRIPSRPPGAEGHLGHKGCRIPGSAFSLAPLPLRDEFGVSCGFPNVVPPAKVNTKGTWHVFLSASGSAPAEGEATPESCWEWMGCSPQAPQEAVPHLRVCRTSLGSGPVPRRPVWQEPVGESVQALPRGRDPGFAQREVREKPGPTEHGVGGHKPATFLVWTQRQLGVPKGPPGHQAR